MSWLQASLTMMNNNNNNGRGWERGRGRHMVPCRFDTMPTGCRRRNCPFLHNNPRLDNVQRPPNNSQPVRPRLDNVQCSPSCKPHPVTAGVMTLRVKKLDEIKFEDKVARIQAQQPTTHVTEKANELDSGGHKDEPASPPTTTNFTTINGVETMLNISKESPSRERRSPSPPSTQEKAPSRKRSQRQSPPSTQEEEEAPSCKRRRPSPPSTQEEEAPLCKRRRPSPPSTQKGEASSCSPSPLTPEEPACIQRNEGQQFCPTSSSGKEQLRDQLAGPRNPTSMMESGTITSPLREEGDLHQEDDDLDVLFKEFLDDYREEEDDGLSSTELSEELLKLINA